jgi:hypothetical protein
VPVERHTLGQAITDWLREMQHRPEPARHVILEDYVMSVADFQAALVCPVRLSQFGYKEKGLVTLKCTHPFHKTCLEPWLREYHTCPLCRTDIDEGE